MKSLIIGLCLLLAGAGFSQAETLVYNGEINKEFVKKVQNTKAEYLRITSTGGALDSALEARLLIRNKDIKMIVDKECLSACAFIFITSRNETFITPDSRLGFHNATLPTVVNDASAVVKKKYTYNDLKFMHEEALMNMSEVLEALHKKGVPVDVLLEIHRKYESGMVYFDVNDVLKYNLGKLYESRDN